MEPRKEYKAPYYAMAVLAGLVIFFFLLLLISAMANGDWSEWLLLLLTATIYISITLGEAIAYWYMRTWKMSRILIWTHISLMYCRLSLLPLLDFQIFITLLVIRFSCHSTFYSCSNPGTQK